MPDRLRNLVFGVDYKIKDKPIKDAKKELDKYAKQAVKSDKKVDQLAKRTKQFGASSVKETHRADQSMQSFNRTLGRVGTAFGAYFGARAIKEAFTTVVGLAGQLQEEVAKFDTVFGGIGGGADQLADNASAWVEEYADRVGRGRLETMKFVSESQNLLVGFGATRGEAFELSKQIQTLGVDLASFSNINDQRALELLQSGLLGNHRATRSLGIALTESTLAAEAASQGYKENFKDLDPLVKMNIRLAVAVQQSTDAIGDAERTSDSYTNQLKRLQGSMQDIGAEAGQQLLPSLTDLITVINENKESIVAFVTAGVNLGIKGVELFTGAVVFATENSNVLLPALGALVGMFAAFKVISIITGLMAAWTAATAAQTTAQILSNGALGVFNALLVANPIGLVIVAVGALIAIGIALWQNWEEIWGGLKTIFENITGAVTDILNLDGTAEVSVKTVEGRTHTSRTRNTPRGQRGPVERKTTYATGTQSARSGIALVGERGPELVRMGGGERVYTNAQTRNMMQGGGGSAVIELNVNGTGVTEETLSQVGDVAYKVIDSYFGTMASKKGMVLNGVG